MLSYLRNLFLILIGLSPIFVTGQGLSETLWKRVDHCYRMFEDVDDDGIPDFDKIDDSKNGYLKISGSWPTCGCSCSATVGAYKNNEGLYTILQSDEAGCSWERKVSSNKPITEILPIDFEKYFFGEETATARLASPLFFVDFEIPRIGTDTKARIQLVPFGLSPKGNGLLCFEYTQEDLDKALQGIGEIAKKITDVQTLDHLLNGDFEKITDTDNTLISEKIGDGTLKFPSIREMQGYLVQLKKAHTYYCMLETDMLILGWDRKESRFFVKERGDKPPHMTFRNFLINSPYFDWRC